jgi:predicted dehydrogenase
MTRQLRVGVIGVGSFGARHVEAYARQPDVSLVAVADRDPQRAEAVAGRWAVPAWFTDGAEMLADCLPDGVSVVTPGAHHVEPTATALAHGCSVLLEKPIAMTSSEACELQSAVRRSGAFVMPAHILRFSQPHIALRSRVRNGELGRVLGVSAQRDRGRDHARRYPDVHPALMTAIHDIDLAMWVSGSRAVRVSAYESRLDGSPRLVWAHVEAADGAVWSLRTSWLLAESATPTDSLEVYGTDATAVLAVAAEPAGALDAEVSLFCGCLRAGSPPDAVTLEEAVHGIRVAEAIVASAGANGEPQEVGR